MVNRKQLFLLATITIIILLVLIGLLNKIYIVNLFNTIPLGLLDDYANDLTNIILSYGSFAVIIFIAIFVFRTLLIVLPCVPLMMLSGHLFGATLGFCYSMISIALSSTLAFYISRKIGDKTIRKIFGKKLDVIDNKIEKHGASVLLTMRLTMLFPLDIVNYAAGLTKIKYGHFILSNVIGLAPECFNLCFLGDSLSSPFSARTIITASVAILMAFTPYIYKKIKPD